VGLRLVEVTGGGLRARIGGCPQLERGGGGNWGGRLQPSGESPIGRDRK